MRKELTMNNHEINAKRRWSFDSVRAACIRNHLYTGGTLSLIHI